MNTLILLAAPVLLALLLYSEREERRAAMIPVKALLSSLFILAAVIQPHPAAGYYRLLLAGLVFCLGGDVCLALPQKKAFLCGLVSFLIGHVFYAFAFFSLAREGMWAWLLAAIAVVISGAAYRWLEPRLGSMKVPVLVYIVVITAMVAGAAAVLGDTTLPWTGRRMIFAGAFLFYLSDLFVARHRFVKSAFVNRLVGLPLYYAGQFLLAFSVGFTG